MLFRGSAGAVETKMCDAYGEVSLTPQKEVKEDQLEVVYDDI